MVDIGRQIEELHILLHLRPSASLSRQTQYRPQGSENRHLAVSSPLVSLPASHSSLPPLVRLFYLRTTCYTGPIHHLFSSTLFLQRSL